MPGLKVPATLGGLKVRVEGAASGLKVLKVRVEGAASGLKVPATLDWLKVPATLGGLKVLGLKVPATFGRPHLWLQAKVG